MKTSLLKSLCVALTLAALAVGCGDGQKAVNVTQEIQNLKSPDANIRIEAATALSTLGPKALPAVGALTEALKDQDPLVRRLAAYALMEIGPEAKSCSAVLQEVMKKETDRGAIGQFVNTLRIVDPNAAADMKMLNVSQ